MGLQWHVMADQHNPHKERLVVNRWWWTRLKTGEKVGTILAMLTLVVAILAIPGVIDLFHWKRADEGSSGEHVRPAPPQGVSARASGDEEVQPDGSVRIPTNVAEKLVIHRVKPEWPKGIDHKVYAAQVLVGPDGKVLGMGLDTSDPQLTDIISDAVSQWKFKPYLRNGKPQKFQSTFYLHS
jgi:hypothetical protein